MDTAKSLLKYWRGPARKPFSSTNKVAAEPGAPQKLKLSVRTKNGLMKGSFADDAKTRKINGVIFQKGNRGAGFFLGETESGLFELTPLQP